MKAAAVGSSLFFLSAAARAATVSGRFTLAGQTDHSGITVTLGSSPTIPAVTGLGIGLLLLAGTLLLRRSRLRRIAPGIALLIAAGLGAAWTGADQTVVTPADGSFSFEVEQTRTYRVEGVKDCYDTGVIDPVWVNQDVMDLGSVEMLEAVGVNEERVQEDLLLLGCAQTVYNNNSMPHTYVSNLHDLVYGIGAGGEQLLPDDFADGIVDGYQITLTVGEPIQGSYWEFSFSAIPLNYGCTGVRSFFVDQSLWNGSCPNIRGEDVGGGPGHAGMPIECREESERLAQHFTVLIRNAETDYNNNSMPHQYTGDIYDLAHGIGAGDVSFLCQELDDGLACGYQYDLSADNCGSGACWEYTCHATPVVYGGDTRLTFYVDESGVVRAGDLGGAQGSSDLPEAEPYLSYCP